MDAQIYDSYIKAINWRLAGRFDLNKARGAILKLCMILKKPSFRRKISQRLRRDGSMEKSAVQTQGSYRHFEPARFLAEFSIDALG